MLVAAEYRTLQQKKQDLGERISPSRLISSQQNTILLMDF